MHTEIAVQKFHNSLHTEHGGAEVERSEAWLWIIFEI